MTCKPGIKGVGWFTGFFFFFLGLADSLGPLLKRSVSNLAPVFVGLVSPASCHPGKCSTCVVIQRYSCELCAGYLLSISVSVGGNRALPAERARGVTRERGENEILPTLQPVRCFSPGVRGVLMCFVSCHMQCSPSGGDVSVNSFGLGIYSVCCSVLCQPSVPACGSASHKIVILWGSLWLLLFYSSRKAELGSRSGNWC